MLRPLPALVSLACLVFAGCGDDANEHSFSDTPATPDANDDSVEDTAEPPAWCDGATTYAYDPLNAVLPTTFPDDFLTVDNAASATGLDVSLTDANAPWAQSGLPPAFQLVFTQLNTLNGFGTTAGIYLRFTDMLGSLPSGETDSVSSDVLQLVELGDDGATRIPYELKITDEGATAILLPMVPLRPASRHAVVLTTEHVAKDGGCIAPGAALRGLLEGATTDPLFDRLVPRYAEALAALDLAPHQVSAAVVFTTQTIEGESAAIAESIRKTDFLWSDGADCQAQPDYLRCERTFTASDYRKDGILADGQPVADYELPVRAWLPLDGEGPWPTIVFGHGLSGDRNQAKRLAEAAVPQGLAVIAIDAAEHGDHPAGTAQSELEQVMAFFGIDTAALALNPLKLRDNWRQSTYDKLQVLRLLQLDADLDADGSPDVKMDELAYFGVSLGGIMGSELLSMTDAFGAGVLAVGGGRVATIIEEASQFEIVITLMKPEGTTDGDVARFFPILQTLIERGDSANYAPHLLRDRLVGKAPHLLMINVIDDDTVPPGTNRMLARALGVPHVPPVLEDVGIIPLADAAPITGNLDDGALTAGFFQYDTITKKEGDKPKGATHSNVGDSREGILQSLTFIQTWLDEPAPTIIDPYAELE